MPLVLQRDFGQSIILTTESADVITIWVKKGRAPWAGVGVAVAIDAPKSVSILRGELA